MYYLLPLVAFFVMIFLVMFFKNSGNNPPSEPGNSSGNNPANDDNDTGAEEAIEDPARAAALLDQAAELQGEKPKKPGFFSRMLQGAKNALPKSKDDLFAIYEKELNDLEENFTLNTDTISANLLRKLNGLKIETNQKFITQRLCDLLNKLNSLLNSSVNNQREADKYKLDIFNEYCKCPLSPKKHLKEMYEYYGKHTSNKNSSLQDMMFRWFTQFNYLDSKSTQDFSSELINWNDRIEKLADIESKINETVKASKEEMMKKLLKGLEDNQNLKKAKKDISPEVYDDLYRIKVDDKIKELVHSSDDPLIDLLAVEKIIEDIDLFLEDFFKEVKRYLRSKGKEIPTMEPPPDATQPPVSGPLSQAEPETPAAQPPGATPQEAAARQVTGADRTPQEAPATPQRVVTPEATPQEAAAKTDTSTQKDAKAIPPLTRTRSLSQVNPKSTVGKFIERSKDTAALNKESVAKGLIPKQSQASKNTYQNIPNTAQETPLKNPKKRVSFANNTSTDPQVEASPSPPNHESTNNLENIGTKVEEVGSDSDSDSNSNKEFENANDMNTPPQASSTPSNASLQAPLDNPTAKIGANASPENSANARESPQQLSDKPIAKVANSNNANPGSTPTAQFATNAAAPPQANLPQPPFNTSTASQAPQRSNGKARLNSSKIGNNNRAQQNNGNANITNGNTRRTRSVSQISNAKAKANANAKANAYANVASEKARNFVGNLVNQAISKKTNANAKKATASAKAQENARIAAENASAKAKAERNAENLTVEEYESDSENNYENAKASAEDLANKEVVANVNKARKIQQNAQRAVEAVGH